MPLRILIADDSRAVRHSLHGLLEQHPGWEVCAEAVDGADAVDKAQECVPDIILLDFFMPGMTGVEAARVLVAEYPFRSSIPTGNDPVEIFTNDGIVGRGNNSCGLRVLTCPIVLSKQGVAQNLQQLAVHD